MACGRHSAHLELFVPDGCRTGKIKDILELFDFAPDGEMRAEGGLKALVWDFMDGDVIPINLHGKLQRLTWRWEGSAARLVMGMSDGCGWYASEEWCIRDGAIVYHHAIEGYADGEEDEEVEEGSDEGFPSIIRSGDGDLCCF